MYNNDLTELDNRVSSNTFGNVINCSGYTPQNPYTFPSDGYLWVFAYLSESCNVGFLNGTLSCLQKDGCSANIYVRKGMQMCVHSHGTNSGAYFYPFN